MPIINGTKGNDSLIGGVGDDTINGGQGHDTIRGFDGADRIVGGEGRDSVFGGEGNDTVVGGRGDIIAGEGGDDLFTFFGDEPDGMSTAFNGGLGVDRLVLDFSAAFDSIQASNSLTGSGNMADVSYSGIEQFVMTGGTASDTLIGSSGDDTLTGGGGNDRLEGKAGSNVFVGGSGRDLAFIDLSATSAAVSVLFTGADTMIGGSSFSGIEALGVDAGSGSDLFDLAGALGASDIGGGDGNDTLNGANAWKDTLEGGAGNDSIEIGRGDSIRGGDGNDTLVFSEGDISNLSTSVNGDIGIDTLIVDFSTAFDRVESSHSAGSGNIEGLSYQGFDRLVLTGGSASDKLVGTGGNDTLTGNGGHDRLDGGGGVNRLVGGANRDIGLIDLSLNIGQPVTVNFKAGDSKIAGTKFVSIESLGLKAADGDDWINVTKAQGGSELYGNAGDDTLTGQATWRDTMDGGAGDDLIHFHHGDSVRGGLGDDDLRIAQAGLADASANVYGDAGLDTLTLDFSGAVADLSSSNGNTGNGSIGGEVDDRSWNLSYQQIEFLLMIGGSGGDQLEAGQGSDTLRGGLGADELDGASDSDYLTGGDGADTLIGGLGVEGDFFIYNTTSDSSGVGDEVDTITDFTLADRIDLAAIDASMGTLEDDAFSFIGSAAFSGVAGELRYQYSGADHITTVSADNDGDGDADLVIDLEGQILFTADQFIL